MEVSEVGRTELSAADPSIIISHSPHIMACAVSDAEFDSRTIPESYIMLREVRKLPFGVSFMDQGW